MARLLMMAFAATLAGIGAAGAPTTASACDSAGVVIRIEGRPQDVVITRTEGGAASVVPRPRVLEVVCRDDVIRAVGGTVVVLSIDGSGTVRVDHNVDYTVPGRHGAPSVMGNAYRTLNDQLMPDMKRLPWNVRIKGGGDDFGFALPGLNAGGQKLHAGSRDLLIRLVGGIAPYKVEIRSAQGAVVSASTSSSHDVLLPRVALAPGDYRISASDATPLTLEASVSAVAAAPPLDAGFSDLADPEVRSAVTATALARGAPASWSFEAEQQLQAAPANGLDRDKVYELIESYSAE